MDTRIFANTIGLVAVALTLAAFGRPALADDIVVAAAGPMTAGQATFGRQMRDGAQQAVADINAAGGVLGRKLRLEIGDDAAIPSRRGRSPKSSPGWASR